MCEGVQHLVSSFMGGQPSFISLLSLLGVYFHFCKVHQEERIASYFLISGQQITLLLGQGSPWALWLLTFPSITPDSICSFRMAETRIIPAALSPRHLKSPKNHLRSIGS